MNTAIITVIKLPEDVLEILVYQSGKNIYTAKTSNMIGRLNKNAIGRPLSSLLQTVFCLSLSLSQYFTNCFSLSESMIQN